MNGCSSRQQSKKTTTKGSNDELTSSESEMMITCNSFDYNFILFSVVCWRYIKPIMKLLLHLLLLLLSMIIRFYFDERRRLLYFPTNSISSYY